MWILKYHLDLVLLEEFLRLSLFQKRDSLFSVPGLAMRKTEPTEQ